MLYELQQVNNFGNIFSARKDQTEGSQKNFDSL